MMDRYSATSYASGLLTGLWGFLSQNMIGILGLIIALATLAINTYYKRRQEERDLAEELRRQELHDAQMKAFLGE